MLFLFADCLKKSDGAFIMLLSKVKLFQIVNIQLSIIAPGARQTRLVTIRYLPV
jgi:hypothetical protein